MAWCEAAAVCRRHPEQIPQPGICPSCLRERLARISNNSRVMSVPSSSPSLSASPVYYYYDSPANSSGGSSRRRGHQRIASDIMDSIYCAIGGSSRLAKSRSMAYAPRNGERDCGGVSRKKNGWFWNKLLLRSVRKKAKF